MRNANLFRISILGFGIFVLFVVPCFAVSSVVDITEIGVGARALGMGRAFSAIADDTSSIFNNPAGLANTKGFGAISMASQVMNELPYTMAGASFKSGIGTIGFGYAGLSANNIYEMSLNQYGTPEPTGNEATYQSTAMVLSLANDAKNIPMFQSMKFMSNAKLGLNIKMFNQAFKGTSSFEAGNGSGFDMDLGTQFKINETYLGSFTLKNLLPGNNMKSDEIPMAIVCGLGYKLPHEEFSWDIDLELVRSSTNIRAGGEWSPGKGMVLRAGAEKKAELLDYSLGVGAKIKNITFDYAYHTFAGVPELASHFFSIGYAGDAPLPASAEAAPYDETKPQVLAAPALLAPINQTTIISSAEPEIKMYFEEEKPKPEVKKPAPKKKAVPKKKAKNIKSKTKPKTKLR